MENHARSNRIHPLIAGAAVSVILVSLVGIAAMTGVLPISHGADTPAATLSSPLAQGGNQGLSYENNANLPVQSRPLQTAQYPSAPPIQTAQDLSAVQYRQPIQQAQAQPICRSCGTVESVRSVRRHVKPSGVGVVAGAVLGGVLGNQIGSGNGRSLATVAGAVGGGYAGNEIEKRSHATSVYQVRVRMHDGHIRRFSYAAQPRWRTGDAVKVTHGRLTLRN